MDVTTVRQTKSKKRKRKLFVQDRSFFGDESLTYPDANPRTIDGDSLKLKAAKKLEKVDISSIYQSKRNHGNAQHFRNIINDVSYSSMNAGQSKFADRQQIPLSDESSIIFLHTQDSIVDAPKMVKVKRKRLDTLESMGPAQKKTNKSEGLGACDHGSQLDENSIIDVVGVSPDDSGHTEISKISGHHEEWHFSSLENSMVKSNSSSLSFHGGQLTENLSQSKKDFVHRFLSDAISTLRMGEVCLDQATSDEDFSSVDITEAADLTSSHSKKQSSQNRKILSEFDKSKDSASDGARHEILLSSSKKTKHSKTRNHFSGTDSLSPSLATMKGRCDSRLNSSKSDSEESVQVLEHIRPPHGNKIKKTSKSRIKDRNETEENSKGKRKKRKRDRNETEEYSEAKRKKSKRGKKDRNGTEENSGVKIKKSSKGRKEGKSKEKRKKSIEESKHKEGGQEKEPKENSLGQFESETDVEHVIFSYLKDVDASSQVKASNQVASINKIHRKKKRVNVEIPSTLEEIHHPSFEGASEKNSDQNSQLKHGTSSSDRNAGDSSHLKKSKMRAVTDDLQLNSNLGAADVTKKNTKKKNKAKTVKEVTEDLTSDTEITVSEKYSDHKLTENKCEDSNSTIFVDSPVTQDMIFDEQQNDFCRIEKKIEKEVGKKNACSETMEQLVQRASSSLNNCDGSNINEYSPDLFDEIMEATNISNTMKEKEKHESDPEKISVSQKNLPNKHKKDEASLATDFSEAKPHMGSLPKTKRKKIKKIDNEMSCGETLQQLVMNASCSLRNSESLSSNEYSPDLFETVSADANKTVNNTKDNQSNQNHEPGQSSFSHIVSSNKHKKQHERIAKKTLGLDSVAVNSSPELIDLHSTWHKLTQDSDGSFSGHSDQISKNSSQEFTGRPYHSMHCTNDLGEMEISPVKANQNSTRSTETNEHSSEEMLISAAVLSLSHKIPGFTSEQNNKLVSKRKTFQNSEESLSLKNKIRPKKHVKVKKMNIDSERPRGPQNASEVVKKSAKKELQKEETRKKDFRTVGSVKCTRCHMWFETESRMVMHKCSCLSKTRTVAEPHRLNFAYYKCKCGKAYVKSSSLNVHIKKVHLGLRPYQCDECPMSFGENQTLVVHKRIHSKTLPFECRICSKQARTVCNLHHHYSQVHRMSPNFPCMMCFHKNVSFFFELDLKEHLFKEHKKSTINLVSNV